MAIVVFLLFRLSSHPADTVLHSVATPEKDSKSPSTNNTDLGPSPEIRSRKPNSTATPHIERSGALNGPGMVQVKMLRNAGRSSARAALETEIYALGAGDVDLVASVITFDPEERTEIIDLLAAVPEDIRTRYQTPERIVAFLFMGGQRMEMLRVVTETPPRDEVAVELIEFKFFDDPTVRKEGMAFTEDPGGWKSGVSAALIKRAISMFNPGAPK